MELGKLIVELGVKFNCKACAELAAKMQQWGLAGCREHRAEIAKEINSRIGEVSWATIALAAAKAVMKFPIDLRDPVGSMVDEAIRRAELMPQ